jgi:hypothetical protein
MVRICLILFTILVSKIAVAQLDEAGEIYSIGIKYRLDQLTRKMVFVADTVSDNDFSMTTRRCAKFFKKFFYYSDSTAIIPGDLDSLNISPKNIFDHYRSISLISVKESNRLFSRGAAAGWIDFYKRYPGYAGIMFLSPVYFNREHTKAIYQLSLASQPCGNGRNSLIFLEKDKNGKWHKTIPVRSGN